MRTGKRDQGSLGLVTMALTYVSEKSRLVEVEMEGHEPYRLRVTPDHETVLEQARRRLALVEQYAQPVLDKIDELRPYAVSLLQNMISS